MNTPKFEICCIARNEVKTIGRLNESLQEYLQRGGIVNLLDTGSEDGTQELARSFGWNVKEVGSKYQVAVHNADEINKMFVVEDEEPIVKEGDTFFDFSAARNDCASMATLPIIFWYDADEVAEKLDIDYVNDLIDKRYTQFEYFFCFAKDAFGNEAVKFIQCKAYDKRVMLWRGKIHELVCNIDNSNPGNRVFIPEDKYKLAHYQNHETGRHSYAVGLAVDVFEFPDNDRHQFYFSRELLYHNRPKSALQGFKKHIAMGGWHSERSESLIHCGDLFGQLGEPTAQMLAYVEAFHTDSGRNAALIKLALYYQWNKNYQAAICYAKAALEIPYNGFYADNLSNYREVPHSVLYACYGFLGRIEEAQTHLNKCLEYQPYNQQYLHDTRFYFEFGAPMIDGWMRWKEIQFLYSEAKKHKVIVEVGSWKGRSTTCICSGNKDAKVYAVDTWAGSQDERDSTNHLAKVEDIFQTFSNNTKQFTNLTPIRKSSLEAAKDFEDGSIDWIFIDAGHTKEEVRADILAWLPKVKDGGMISGHDFEEGSWMSVVEGVNSVFVKPDGVCDSIWYVEMSDWKRCIINTWLEESAKPKKEYEIEFKHNLNEESAVEVWDEKKTELIPRKVYTAWLSADGSMPDIIKKCIDSQKRMCDEFGYEHHVFTLDNIPTGESGINYLSDAVNSKYPDGVKYCKATDYLRFWALYNFGGIFLDSDVECIKPFDAMLNDKMFIGLELADWVNGKVVLGTAVMGSTPNHPFFKWILNEMESKFSGADNFNYESSMELLNIGGVNFQKDFTLYEPEYFHPKNSATGELKVTDKTVCIHQFTKLWTPEVNQKSTLQQFKYNIENNINFTFVKRGDGELACMRGDAGGNCDGHPYSKELGEKLWEAYEYLGKQPNTTIVEFDDQKNYNVLLHRTDSNLKEVSEFYKAIQKSERRKVLVAPEKLKPIADLLNATHIIIPEINVWEDYDVWVEKINLYEAAIYLFCAGMPAKVMIAELMRDVYDAPFKATFIDCGSAFDCAVSPTRTFQISKEQFWELYEEKKWDSYEDVKKRLDFEKSLPVNNFNLSQEGHPEKLWVLNQVGCEVKTVYDLGAGTFKKSPHFIGVDVRPVTDMQCSIDELPLDNNSGDIIVSSHSFEHLLDPAKAMKEWIRVLKPGGKMIIVLPDHEFINTLDPYYSAGQHFHAYTRETFANFISLFPELAIAKQETVLENWSFGTVIQKLPTISVIIPHMDGHRENGLAETIKSLSKGDYPIRLIKLYVMDGDHSTVPEKVKKALSLGTSPADFYCYAANDMVFEPNCLLNAVMDSIELNKGLVSFNEGSLLEDKGNICTHFIIRKDIIPKLENGEIFSTDFNHVGVDNWLWAQCEKMGEAHWCESAKIIHNHFSKGSKFDEVYEKGWSHVEQDRATLKQKLEKLNS